MASTYTDADKADAVRLYLEHGLAEAHHRTGVPKPTLKRWLAAAGHDPSETAARSVAKTAAATEAHTARLEELRVKARAEFAESAVFAARQVRSSEKGNDAQGWAMAGGICLDKVRLELGEATERHEHGPTPERTPEQEAELAKVVDLAQRRAA